MLSDWSLCRTFLSFFCLSLLFSFQLFITLPLLLNHKGKICCLFTSKQDIFPQLISRSTFLLSLNKCHQVLFQNPLINELTLSLQSCWDNAVFAVIELKFFSFFQRKGYHQFFISSLFWNELNVHYAHSCHSSALNTFLFLQWFDLEEVTTGKLHLKLEWLSLYPSAEKLDQVCTNSLTDTDRDDLTITS